MNNLKKIGLSALAGSLVSFSAGAAEMSVSGGAAIYFDDTNRGKATRGNGFYMGDSLNFSASGETDNGIAITVKYELDNAGTLDDYSLSMGGDWGTLVFDGHGASSAMGAVDDVVPNAYEEAWDVIDTDGTGTTGSPTVIGGGGGNNMFIYTSPTVGGATFKMAYQNDGGAAAVSDSYMDFALAFSPEQVEGLTLGYATRDKDMGVNIDEDADTMYIKYAFGPLTVGAQASESSHTTATLSKESTSYGVTYAVNDDMSIGFASHTLETDLTTDADQESLGISFSYTMGGMTLAGAMNEVDAIAGTATRDAEGYEFGLSFAF